MTSATRWSTGRRYSPTRCACIPGATADSWGRSLRPRRTDAGPVVGHQSSVAEPRCRLVTGHSSRGIFPRQTNRRATMSVTEVGKKATVACPFCATLNRVDLGRLADRPKCGKCGRPILLDRPVAVTDATVDAVLGGTEVPVVMDCYAEGCGPCKIMAPILDEFAHDRQGEVLVIKLDTDRNQATARRFDIRAIPTLIVFRQGREAARRTGVIPRRELDALVGTSGPA